ncbi:hypothetical protein GCM10020256_35010 [Streptomyces thermocoprophilus]
MVTAFGVGACAAAEALDGLALLLSVHAAALTGFLTQQHRHFLVRRHRHTAAHLAPSGPSHSTQVRQPLIAPHRPPLAARPRQSAGAALGASGGAVHRLPARRVGRSGVCRARSGGPVRVCCSR